MNKFGLTTEEASKALSEQGNNALTQPPRETFWDKLWENFKDPITVSYTHLRAHET